MSEKPDRTPDTQQIYEISLALFGILDQEELYKQIATMAEQLFDTQVLSLMLKGPHEDLYIVKAVGLDPKIIEGAKQAVGEGIAGRVFLQDTPLILHGRSHPDPSIQQYLQRKEIHSSLISPVKLQSHPMGVLNLARTARADGSEAPAFDPKDGARVLTFCHLIAQAIENANIHRQLSQFSDQHLAEAYRRLQNAYDELQKTQDNLLNAERLSVVGRVAASLAHDIRNPLSVIKASTQFLLKKYTLEPAVRERLEVVTRNAAHAEDILTELLNLAKPQAPDAMQPTALKDLLDLTLATVEPKYKEAGHRVVSDYGPLPLVAADAKRLQRVFLNFAVNAFEAMGDSGTLTMSARSNERNVVIQFKDTGAGMPPEVLNRLGQPFNTTKKHGMGLGLYGAKQTIESHGGTLSITSQPGEGTTISVSLPLAPPPGAA